MRMKKPGPAGAIGVMLVTAPVAVAQFSPVDQVLPPEPGTFDDFGADVAVLGDRLLVCAPADDDVAPDAGVAFLFDAQTGALVRTLAEPGLSGTDRYAYAAAIGPAAAMVSAWGYNAGGGVTSGAIFLYDPATGEFIDAYAPIGTGSGDRFGFSIDVDGDLAIAGSPSADGAVFSAGAAVLLDMSIPSSVAALGRLAASDGSLGSDFGFSVAIHGDYALVGAPRDGEVAPSAGAAYLFDISDPLRPAQVAKLTASDGEDFDLYGKAVALHGTIAVVGAPDADQSATSGAGAAYVYDISDPSNPREVAVLGEAESGVLGNFGLFVATDGENVLVAAPQYDGGASNAGIIFVYDARTGTALGPIRPATPSFGARFGTGLDFAGRQLAVGAPRDDASGVSGGAAYLYAASCVADLDGDGELTLFDFLAFQNLFDAGDLTADFDGDGELTLFDFLAFQNAFDLGCD